MLRLILFRHAKSSWAYPELSDFERPLNERGRRDAPMMASRLLPFVGKTFTVFSSPACRAAATARLAVLLWKKADTTIQYQANLYHATVESLWQFILSQNSKERTLVVFGHNEGLTELAEQCSRGIVKHMPTAGIVVFDFEAEKWPEITLDSARLVQVDFPKKA